MNVDKIKKEIIDLIDKDRNYFISAVNYEDWYSKALFLVSKLLPHRKQDFILPYSRIIGEIGVDSIGWNDNKYKSTANASYLDAFNVKIRSHYHNLDVQIGILKAALDSLDSYIYDISQQLLYNIFDDELVAAEHLIKNGFFRASGTMAGVVLETHLKTILQKHNIDIVEKNPALAVLYEKLYDNKIIDIDSRRNIEWICGLRNKCSHNKESEPTKTDVEELISGVKKIISTIN